MPIKLKRIRTPTFHFVPFKGVHIFRNLSPRALALTVNWAIRDLGRLSRRCRRTLASLVVRRSCRPAQIWASSIVLSRPGACASFSSQVRSVVSRASARATYTAS